MYFKIAGGGEMISDVYLDHSTYTEPPSRLVACKFVLDLCLFVQRQGKNIMVVLALPCIMSMYICVIV